MSNSSKLDQQLEKLRVELNAAKSAKAAAGEKLATDPANTELIAAAREATANVQALAADIDILESARSAANAADARDAAEAIRANALRNMDSIEKLLAQRVKAAKQIDEALARLRQANANWLAVNDSCSTTIEAFNRAAYVGLPTHDSFSSTRGMKNEVANAIVDNFAEALKGFEAYQIVSFNHLRRNAHETESAERDASNSSARYWSRLCEVARAKGLK